ncbi:asparagine synthase (glutamine-hydrolyzing) [Kitasatospora sp. MAP12-15]|uniref:asparagine synthase (glutamine-hydrolyzing) n=1 Tax=unclassified Kitasatospora TaxID=2633591 RepID=UPI0024739A5C|nr:asparagine synthase (glutamine-hydrolyzing) [Kitasatospora sp. MAP12-44]MDH6113748.1 asparagine synthase (glutamine-hydrolyzing) [Kitasatospora sp. MAP12-44]
MSGIAGWVDFERDMSRETATVRAMSATLAHRGPDGAGEWIEGHAALAQRRLALLDLDAGAGPAIAPAANPAAVLTLDGAITNHVELSRELAAKGHRFAGRSEAEVALYAYLEWGPDFLTRLEGLFALAVWDVRRQELLLARDRLGVKPLCYYRTSSGILFGSEPKALLAHPEVRPVVDADGLRELFAHSRKPGTGVFQGMREVLPGHRLVLGRSGGAEQRYWELSARPHTDSLDTTVATVRELLADAVSKHLRADVPVAAMLSGGIDSSALTALAQQSLRQSGAGTLRTFSVNFAGYTENFEPHPTMRATPDAPFADLAARHIGTTHTEILLDTAALAERQVHAAALRVQDAPSPLGDMDVSLLLFFGALRRAGVSAVLSGETADEVFNGYFWAYDPSHSNSQTFPWVSFERGHDAAAGGLGCSLVDLGLRKQLNFLEYADQHYRDALTEVPHVPGESPQERRAREVSYLALTRWAPTHLDRADRMSMAHGVQLRPPFCDRALVEYVYNVPATLKRVDGQEKSLLRTAVADLLPEQVLNRRKSAYPTTQDAVYGELVRARFAELAADCGSAVAPLLDEQATAAALAADGAPQGPFAWVERASMEMMIQLDTWLTEYQVDLRL